MATPRPVEQADLFCLKFLQFAKLSPDGKWAAYVVGQVNAEEEKAYSAIWLVALDSGETRQLTSGTAVDSSPNWSPDGRQIAFLSTRAEKAQIYLIAIDGGEARPLTSLEQGVGGGPIWSPDGQYIAFTAARPGEARDKDKPYRVTRSVYRFNGLGLVDDALQSLYVVAVNDGEPRQVTSNACLNGTPQWSPDGKTLLYIATMLPEVFDVLGGRLHVVDLVDGAVRELLGAWGAVDMASWLPDGQHIAIVGQPKGLNIGSKSDVWLTDRYGMAPVCRTASLKVGVEGGLVPDMPINFLALPRVLISADGQFACVNVQQGGTISLYRVGLHGAEAITPLVTGDRACIALGLADRHLLYVVNDFNLPPDLYVSDVNGKHEKRLTDLNHDLLASLTLPAVERLQFPGSDGTPVEGWLLTPRHTGIAPYPMLLLVHGGPHLGWGHMFNFHAQLFCGAGYAVLQINHRASTGYGDEFSTAIKGDWGNLDFNDLMAGVDYVIAKGCVDPEKMGIYGRSGGGNLTCWTVGHTTRFKAAVPENPVTNWQTFYGVSDIGVWFAVEQLGGHPHEIPEIYARCSPITYAHCCRTPTLLLQGEADWRCPPEQSEQFYTVLKANGCTVEMVRFPNAPHHGAINGDPVVRRVHNETLLGWMNRYVLGKSS